MYYVWSGTDAQSEDITVEQYFQAVATSPVSNSTVDVVLYLYCLLRDNLLSLSSVLRFAGASAIATSLSPHSSLSCSE